MKYTFENVAPWFFNKKQEWFLTIIHCKSADIFPVQTKQLPLSQFDGQKDWMFYNVHY